jgi:integrase
MLVAFDCYLRVGELTQLRLRDIVMPFDARMGSVHTGMAVCLSKTKTGLNQSVPLQSTAVAEVLCLWVRSLPQTTLPSALVFSFRPPLLRRLMREACVSLGLGHTHYVPHSLRHGGATADFLRTHSVEHVQFRGRWRSMESCRRYVQSAQALLAQQQVPPELNDLGQQLSCSLVQVMTEARRVTFAL